MLFHTAYDLLLIEITDEKMSDGLDSFGDEFVEQYINSLSVFGGRG